MRSVYAEFAKARARPRVIFVSFARQGVVLLETFRDLVIVNNLVVIWYAIH